MIHDVDESLRELLRRDVMNGAGLEISFDIPSAEWAARRTAPALNLYLYDIQEALKRREVQYQEVRNDQGIVVARVMPPRRYKLSYLVTAWTQRPEDEHRLLSAVLSCFIRSDAVPQDVLQGGLAGLDEPVHCTIALPLPPERSISDLWSTLGGGLKASLDLVVTAPFATGRHQFVGPPVTEEPFVRVRPGKGTLEEVAGGSGRGSPDKGDARGETDEAVGPAISRETVERGKIKVGRRFEMISVPKPSTTGDEREVHR